MDRGAYVPDELTNALIADRLARTDTGSGFLLDGYPRTTDRADYLDQLLAQRGQVLERVVNFRVDHEELIGRLLQRAIEQGRREDTEAVIRRRQEVYVEETAPLLASYADRGILITIDGSGGVEDVARRALDALAASAETSPESDLHATPRRGGS
jgi:adenylate kinase